MGEQGQVFELGAPDRFSRVQIRVGYETMKHLVSFPDPTSREEKGLVYLGRILGSRSTARADPAMQSSDLIGLYGRTGD